MNEESILAMLRAHQATLRERGVLHAALFGSRARGDAGVGSDTDVMVGIDPEAHIGVWCCAGVKECIASLLDGLAPAATLDAIYAF